MRVVDKAEIVEKLRRGHPTGGARRVDVAFARAREIERRHIRPLRIGLALSKEKSEPGVPGGELVHHARRNHAPVTESEIMRAPKHFSERRTVGENLRPAVQRIALQRVVVREKEPPEHAVVGIEVVINAQAVRRSPHLGRRVPQEGSKIQTIALGEVVGRRIIADDSQHYGIEGAAGNVVRIIRRRANVIGPNTTQLRRRRTIADAGDQVARAVDEQGAIARDRGARNHQRVGRIRHKVTEDAAARRGGVSNGHAKGLVNRLGKVDAIVLVAAKEESLVLLDRPTHFKSVLAQANQRLRCVLCVRKEFAGIQRLVAEEEEAGAVKFTRPGAGGDGNRRAAVATFFGRRVIGRNLVFLNVVRINAIEIAYGVRHRRFVGPSSAPSCPPN